MDFQQFIIIGSIYRSTIIEYLCDFNNISGISNLYEFSMCSNMIIQLVIVLNFIGNINNLLTALNNLTCIKSF